MMNRFLKLYEEAKQPIEMIYHAKNGSITQRKILVTTVDEKSITAYCYLRKTKRTFLINNILSFKPLKRKKYEEIM